MKTSNSHQKEKKIKFCRGTSLKLSMRIKYFGQTSSDSCSKATPSFSCCTVRQSGGSIMLWGCFPLAIILIRYLEHQRFTSKRLHELEWPSQSTTEYLAELKLTKTSKVWFSDSPKHETFFF